MDIYIVIAFFCGLTTAQNCLVDNFSVQENFVPEKFAGKWYEISWVQYYFEPPYDNYLDFVQNYTVVNSSYVSLVNAGRVKLGDASCNIDQGYYDISEDNPAKWSAITTRGDIDYRIEHWIIATDYDNYAFVYGCTRKNANGTCGDAHAWKWSRTPNITSEHLVQVDAAMNATCMGPDNYTFVASEQLVECELVATDITAAASSQSKVNWVLVCIASLCGVLAHGLLGARQ